MTASSTTSISQLWWALCTELSVFFLFLHYRFVLVWCFGDYICDLFCRFSCGDSVRILSNNQCVRWRLDCDAGICRLLAVRRRLKQMGEEFLAEKSEGEEFWKKGSSESPISLHQLCLYRLFIWYWMSFWIDVAPRFNYNSVF